MKFHNTYYLLRHGEALSNVKEICSSWPETFENHLTAHGREQVKKATAKLQGKTIDMIFYSPLLRTQETAGIVAKKVNVKPVVDVRLKEIDFGTFNGKPIGQFRNYFKEHGGSTRKKALQGESYAQVSRRVVDFFRELNRTYTGKTIVIVSHQATLLLLYGYIRKHSIAESIKPLQDVLSEKRITRGELIEIK